MAKLSELKALLAARDKARTKAPTPAAAPKAKRPPEKALDAEVDFRQALGDIDPLPARNKARLERPAPSTLPVQRMLDDAAALLASKFGTDPAPARWDIGQELEEAQTFMRTGSGSDVLARLRRGQWVVQGELDLHRLTSEQAHDALADFLFASRHRGWRCVRVIHGKGLSSPGGEPVLKGKVRRWLTRWDDVLAYCEAPAHGGGSGAVLVLLKAAGA